MFSSVGGRSFSGQAITAGSRAHSSRTDARSCGESIRARGPCGAPNRSASAARGTSTTRSPRIEVRQARTRPSGPGGGSVLPDKILTTHLPHTPAPPHGASTKAPARSAARRRFSPAPTDVLSAPTLNRTLNDSGIACGGDAGESAPSPPFGRLAPPGIPIGLDEGTSPHAAAIPGGRARVRGRRLIRPSASPKGVPNTRGNCRSSRAVRMEDHTRGRPAPNGSRGS